MSPAELHAWSDEIAHRHLAEPLLGRYRVARVDRETWERSFDLVREDVFPGDAQLDLRRAWSEARLRRFNALNTLMGTPIEHNLILYDQEEGDAPMGWYHGAQDMRATYYMAITGLHPAWRGRKIYPAFLDRMLGMLDELGFREILSRHQANNNAVLIPKLRAGFQIAAFEMAPNYGFLVHLRYNFSEAMRAVYAWRIDARVGGAELVRLGVLKPDLLPPELPTNRENLDVKDAAEPPAGEAGVGERWTSGGEAEAEPDGGKPGAPPPRNAGGAREREPS